MIGHTRVSQAPRAEQALETAIRKLYPYLNRLRNPVRVSYNGQRKVLHHGGRKDHFYAVYQCFYQRQYELPRPLFTPAHHEQALDGFYADILARGATPLILDCGANIGASVLWFSARYPEAHIIAVEPAAQNIALLRRNVAGSGVDVVEGAVGAQDGRAFLSGRAESPLSFRVGDQSAGRGAGEGEGAVDVFGVASLLARAPEAEPFLLKIDIEGGERGLFSGDTSALSRFPLIVLEPHDFCMPGEDVSAPFFAFHAREQRDFLFANENIFSIDYARLTGATSAAANQTQVQTEPAT
jgi:FkbM family methyltransferase